MANQSDFIPKGWRIKETSTPEQQPGYLESLGNVAKGTVGSVAKGVGDVAKIGHDFLTNPRFRESIEQMSPEMERKSLSPNLDKSIEKQLGSTRDKLPTYEGLVDKIFGSENMKGGNIATENLYRTARNAPLLAIMGAAGPVGLASDYTGGISGSLAKSIGLGEGAQLGANVLGNLGFGRAANILKGTPTQRSKYINDKFNKIEEVGSKINAKDSNPLGDILKAEKELSTATAGKKTPLTDYDKSLIEKNIPTWTNRLTESRLPEKSVNNLRHSFLTDPASSNAQQSLNELSNQNLRANDLYNLKKDINSIYREVGEGGKKVLDGLRGSVSGALEKVGENNPKFGSIYKDADELWKIKNWANPLTSFIEEKMPDGKYTKYIPSSLARFGIGALLDTVYPGYLSKGLMGSGIATAALEVPLSASKGFDMTSREGKFLNKLMESPEGKKLTWEIIGSSAKKSSNAIASSLNKLNNFAEKFEKNNPEKDNKESFVPKGWKIKK